MLQPILVPLDGSDLAERALPYAKALAGPGCQLILLEVGQDVDDLSLLQRQAAPCARLETATGDPAQQILRVAQDLGAGLVAMLLERHTVSCARLETAVGDPTEQILRVAKALHVGLIVMTTHGRGALGRWAFGSVADRVTRTAPMPVMVVRPRDGEADAVPVIWRLVVPLDGSPVAEQSLPTAQALAQQLNVPVHLVIAIDPTSLMPAEIMPTVAFDASLYAETVAQLEADATTWLTQTAEQLQHEGVATTWAILHGSPFLAITDAVKLGDVIVMTSHGRGGAKRWLLGSLAEKLIREGPAPVVLVPLAVRHDAGPVTGDAAQFAAPVLA